MRRQMLYKYLNTLRKLLSCVRPLKLHERYSTSAYDDETQNSYGEETQRTPYACTRADHGSKRMWYTLQLHAQLLPSKTTYL